MPHKILHFVNTFIPTYGGKTNRIYNLCLNDGADHVIHVPFPSKQKSAAGRALKGSEQISNITIVRHTLESIPNIAFPLLNYLLMILQTKYQTSQIVNWVHQDGFKIAYGHTPLEFGLAALRFSKKNRLPFIYEVHGLIYDNLWRPEGRVRSRYHGMMQQFYASNEKRILDKADALIAQTHSMKARISEVYGIGPEKIQVVYNGVSENFLDPMRVERKSELYRRERGWGGKRVIMYSGFLDSINGVDFLVEAVSQLPECTKRQIKVVFLGRGHYEEYLRKASADYEFIEYLGLVDYEEMPFLYGCADLFVIPRPSTLPSETLVPIKLLEAMAMEKVVLVSNVGGLTEIVRDQRNGLIFSKGDKADFIAKLEYAIERIQNLKALGIQARKDVLEKYTWRNSRDVLRKVYRRLSEGEK